MDKVDNNSRLEHRLLIFGSKEISYELTYKNRTTLGIRVLPDCRVKVIAPYDTPEEMLESRLKQKAPWIIKQQMDFLSYHPLTPPRKFISGETHLYLGRQYRLRIDPGDRNELKLYRGRMVVQTKSQMQVQNILSDWYRDKARFHFENMLDEIFPRFLRFNINKPELVIREMPTRWGSCTPSGKVILNPELVKAPKRCIEYVIIHELCHLIHHNHTASFYKVQEKMMPDWKKWKDRLERILV